MSSNTSQRRAQALILRAGVADYRGWILIADCGACGPRRLPLERMPSTTMMQLLMRLRCHGCGGRVASAAIENKLTDWRHRLVRIWGPGSFG